MSGVIAVAGMSTGAALNAAIINTKGNAVEAEVNKHIYGTSYRHLFAELDSSNLDNSAAGAPVAWATTATDGQTRQVQVAAGLARLAVGSATSNWATALSGLATTAHLAGHETILAGRTNAATASTLVSRDTAAFSSFGGVVVTPAGSGAAAAYAGANVIAPAGYIGSPYYYSLGGVLKYKVDNDGTVVSAAGMTAPTFTGALVGNATTATSATNATNATNAANVPAWGITGTIAATQIHSDIARAAAVPTNAGVGASGSWGISITGTAGNVTGIVAVPDGGTGLATLPAKSLIIGNGTGGVGALAPGANKNYVQSNGTDFVSAPFDAGAIPVGSVAQSRLSDLYARPGVAADGAGFALRVYVNPGEPWNGNVKQAFLGGLSPAIDPTGIGAGNSRVDLLVINAANALAWVQGVAAANPQKPTLGGAQVPVWYVKVYPGATSITGYSDTGAGAFLMEDGRAVFLNPTGAGASVSAAPLGATYATIADEAASLASSTRIGNRAFGIVGAETVFTQSYDPMKMMLTPANGGYAAGTMRNGVDISTAWADAGKLRGGVDHATHNDLLRANYISPNFAAAVSFASATVVQVAASAGSAVAIAVAGRLCVANATVQAAPLTGEAGMRYYYAEANATGAGFSLVWSTSNTPGAGQRFVTRAQWNGTTLVGAVDRGPMIPLTISHDLPLRRYRMPTAGGVNTQLSATAYADVTQTGVSPPVLYAQRPLIVAPQGLVTVVNTSATAYSCAARILASTNGGAYAPASLNVWLVVPAGQFITFTIPPEETLIAEGANVAFKVGVFSNTGIPAGNSVYIFETHIWGPIFSQ